ncbi:zf-HC2 domain-containing protein [Acidobacteriota bacterium]
MTCTDKDIGKLIGGFELGLLSDEEKRLFENHLLNCEYCFQDLYRTAPLIAMMREGEMAPSREFDLTGEKKTEAIPQKPPGKNGIFRTLRRFRIYAAAGAVAVLAAVFILVWLQGPGQKAEQLRGHDDISILVQSPVGEVASPSELRWKPVGGVRKYDVKLYSDMVDLLWEGSSQETKVVLPDSIREILTPGQSYLWQVEALTAKGDRLKSQMIRFKIR